MRTNNHNRYRKPLKLKGGEQVTRTELAHRYAKEHPKLSASDLRDLIKKETGHLLTKSIVSSVVLTERLKTNGKHVEEPPVVADAPAPPVKRSKRKPRLDVPEGLEHLKQAVRKLGGKDSVIAILNSQWEN